MPFSEMVSCIRAFAFIEPWAIDISHLQQRVFARYGGRLVGVGHDTELTLYRVSAANDTELAQLKGKPPLMGIDAIDTLPRQPNDLILVVIGMIRSYLCFAMLMWLNTMCEH